jgi:Kef-type K+ transport system membrane component KefB
MDQNIFLQISILLGITITIAFLVRLLKQPLLIAYIVAGTIAGPLFLNILNAHYTLYEALAQFGVVLLLFVVGLSLNFNHLRTIGKTVLVVGIAQVCITSLVGTGLLLLLHQPLLSSIYLAVAVTFSSTVIIIKLLSDKKDLESTYGRYTVGLMLVQDVIAIIIMILISTLDHDQTFAASIGLLLGKGAVLGLIIFLISYYILPILLKRIALSSEFLFIFTVAWCFGVANLVYWSGFSVEIGAIVAGLSLGSSPYQPEIISRIKPLRDFFLILFFIILGSQLSFTNLNTTLLPGIVLSLFILIGNPFILYFLFRSYKFTRRNSLLIGVTAAQVSEFGFILLFTGQKLGSIQNQELSIFTFVALITIFFSSYIITYNNQIYSILTPWFLKFGKDKYLQKQESPILYDVWVFGYHRIGWKVCEALVDKKMKFAVVDFNPEAITKLKNRNIPAFFGDASDVEFLSTLSLERAKLIILTLPDPDDEEVLVRYIRSKNKRTAIIANLTHHQNMDMLYKSGANYVMLPHLLGGQWIADFIKRQSLTATIFKHLKKEQQRDLTLKYTKTK